MKFLHILKSFLSAITFAGFGNLFAQQKPNVIFIYADDLGKGLLSAYGQQQFTTPNIDSLVHRGTSFTRAYGCMVSAPARASLLTGYHDCRTDKWKISGGGEFVNYRDEKDIQRIEKEIDKNDITLPKNDLYLPQVFQQAGYVTAQIGKLEWGFTATRRQMQRHGWDYYYGYLDHVRCHGFYPPWLFDNGKIVDIAGNTHLNCGKSIEQETPETYAERHDRKGKAVYSQDLFIEKILTFIRENKNKPFFLFHPTQLPHGPVAVPEVYPEIANNPALTAIEKEYASMVKMLDIHVGMIMQELRKQGLEENTIVIFSSDNGHEIYYSQKGRVEKPYRNLQTGNLFDDFADKYYTSLSGDVFNGNASMAGLKRSNLEGGVNVPLTFYWKGRFAENSVSTQLVSNYDLLPTFAEMLGVKLSAQKDGISIWKTLTENVFLSENRYVVYGSNLGPAIIENSGWKLRHYAPKNVFELYNLNIDPQERSNLIDNYPEIAEKLKAILINECNGDLRNGINRAG